MIYNGLEFGLFFEVPFRSPCYMILRGVNPVLQMVFTFMQMYFIFMNSRVSTNFYHYIGFTMDTDLSRKSYSFYKIGLLTGEWNGFLKL